MAQQSKLSPFQRGLKKVKGVKMADYKIIYRVLATDEKIVTVPDDWTEKQVKDEFEAEYYETEIVAIQKIG